MTDDLSEKTTMDPDDLGTHLRELGDTLSNKGEATLKVQGEDLKLHPASKIDYKIEGATRDGTLRGDKESIEISMSWDPDDDL